MITELALLRYLCSSNLYNTYATYVDKEYLKENYIDLYKIYILLDILHGSVRDHDFTVDELEARFYSNYPKADRGIYEKIFNRIREINVSEDVAVEILEEHRKRAIAHRVSEIAFDVSQGTGDMDKLVSEMKHFETDTSLDETDFNEGDMDLDRLKEKLILTPGLKFRLRTMRMMYGSLRKGDFGFIFTRPEVGKTTMLASEGSFMASQADSVVVHFNNEEEGDRIRTRYVQAALGVSIDQLFSDTRGNMQRYREATGDKIRVVDQPALHRAMVERYCEIRKPSLIIIDSIDKIKGFKEDRDDLVYKDIYQWARELAKEYAPVIGVCHAAVRAEGKSILRMDDVAYAKTAKQGEADWILGIGQVFDKPGYENVRYLSAPKNKLLGDEESVESMRHTTREVIIQPELARYIDLAD
jgi:hypothetical protein